MNTAKRLNLIISLLIASSMAGCALSAENVAGGRIVFRANRDGNYDLYIMSPDGSNQQKLASFPGRTFAPNDNNGLIPSPSGKQIAFLSDKDGDFGIYVIDIESGAQSNLTKNQGAVSSFAWSPDGKHIAFVSDRDAVLIDANRGLWTNNIYVMNANGANVRKLTSDDTTSDYGGLSWSPDGNKLALDMVPLSPRGGPPVLTIYLMTLGDSKLVELTSPTDQAQSILAWSPDGKQIMYLVGTKQLYVMHTDGGDQVPLLNDDLGFVISAAWSPDGRRIAFSSVRDGKHYLYTVKADGTNLVALSKDPSNYDTSPSWSPDGKSIVFASKRDGGKYHLYVMNADGTNQRRLTNGPGEEAAPIWLWAP